ncbi:MAG: O-antigen ligase family protein [Elusimicrobia bacterium]|nr:O-antigen ligase family protein [Elusimicrobiota bacterium]
MIAMALSQKIKKPANSAPEGIFLALTKIILWALLLPCAFDMRGAKIGLGPLSFYLTTSRIAIFLICALTAPWFFKKALPLIWREYRELFLSGCAFLLIAGLAAFLGRHPGLGAERLLFYGSFFYLFCAGLVLPGRFVRKIPLYIFALGVVLAAIGCWEFYRVEVKVFLDYVFIPMTGNQSRASFQNPTTFGCLTVIALACGWIYRERLGLATLLFSCLALTGGVIFSASRLAALGLAVFMLGLAALLIFSGRSWKNFLVALTLAAAFFWTMSHYKDYFGPQRIKQAFIKAGPAFSSPEAFDAFSSRRYSAWKAAWSIWKDHPWLGVGPGAYDRHMGDYEEHKPLWLGSRGFEHPHNLFFWILSETGLAGIAAFFIFCYFLVRRIVNAGPIERAWPLAMFLFFEMFELLVKDAYPSLILTLLALYAARGFEASEPENSQNLVR